MNPDLLVLIIAALVAASGDAKAVSQPPPPPSPPIEVVADPRSIDSGSQLNEVQLHQQSVLARDGDAAAAFRLSRHYEAVGDEPEKRYWSVISAARGHRGAQYSLGFWKLDEASCVSAVESMHFSVSPRAVREKGHPGRFSILSRRESRLFATDRQDNHCPRVGDHAFYAPTVHRCSRQARDPTSVFA
jgi:hypothetical protein